MSSTEARPDGWTAPSPARSPMKLEVVVLPVSDVDQAAEFYAGKLGWRLDVDARDGDSRIVHLTPPGSSCSVMVGTGLTSVAPGSARFLHLVVPDIEAAHAELVDAGIETSGVFHDPSGAFNRFDPSARASGPDPERRSYASFAAFDDPDGNGWVLQEVTTRFPGRIDAEETAFASVPDLAGALRRARAAYLEHKNETGHADGDLPMWYASYMVAEQLGSDSI